MNGLETRYFHLDQEAHTPANSDLIDGIINNLGQVEPVSLAINEYATRFQSGGLVAGLKQDDKKYNSVVVEAATLSFGKKASDLGKVLLTVSHPNTGVRGDNSTIYSYFEGRDDHEEKTEGGVPDIYQFKREIGTNSHYRQKAMAFLDVHSFETIRQMMEVNEDKEQPEIVSLTAMPLFVEKLEEDGFLENGDTVVAAPDWGSFAKAREMSRLLGKPMIFIDKERPRPHEINIKDIYLIHDDGQVERIDGDNDFLKDKRVIFFDDSIDTGETSVLISQEVKKHGAKQAIFCATHALFGDQKPDSPVKSIQGALADGDIDYMYVSDSLPFYKKVKHNHLKIVSVAGLFASLIKIAADKATSKDFNLVKRCLYNPVTDKDEIEKHFREGNISPAFEGFDYNAGVFGNQENVVFSRKPGRAN